MHAIIYMMILISQLNRLKFKSVLMRFFFPKKNRNGFHQKELRIENLAIGIKIKSFSIRQLMMIRHKITFGELKQSIEFDGNINPSQRFN